MANKHWVERGCQLGIWRVAALVRSQLHLPRERQGSPGDAGLACEELCGITPPMRLCGENRVQMPVPCRLWDLQWQ